MLILVVFHCSQVSWVLKFHVSIQVINKGYVGRTIRVGAVLKQERSNWKKRKWSELSFNYLSTKIAWKFQWKTQLCFTLKLPEIMQKSTFIIKKIKNLHLNSKSLSDLKNSEVSLKQFLWKNDLQRKQFIVETCITYPYEC